MAAPARSPNNTPSFSSARKVTGGSQGVVGRPKLREALRGNGPAAGYPPPPPSLPTPLPPLPASSTDLHTAHPAPLSSIKHPRSDSLHPSYNAEYVTWNGRSGSGESAVAAALARGGGGFRWRSARLIGARGHGARAGVGVVPHLAAGRCLWLCRDEAVLRAAVGCVRAGASVPAPAS